jgi:hypothetical protein
MKVDCLLKWYFDCPRYDQMVHEIWNRKVDSPPEVMRERTTAGKAFWKRVLNKTGLPQNSTDQFWTLWVIPDTLFIEKTYNRTLPEWVDQKTYDHLADYYNFFFQALVYNQTMARLSGGKLLKVNFRIRGRHSRTKFVNFGINSNQLNTIQSYLLSSYGALWAAIPEPAIRAGCQSWAGPRIHYPKLSSFLTRFVSQ